MCEESRHTEFPFLSIAHVTLLTLLRLGQSLLRTGFNSGWLSTSRLCGLIRRSFLIKEQTIAT